MAELQLTLKIRGVKPLINPTFKGKKSVVNHANPSFQSMKTTNGKVAEYPTF